MKWIDLANLAIPLLGMILPRARPVLPIIWSAANEAQKAFPDNNEAREAKREHVFRAVAGSAEAASQMSGKPFDVGEAIAATQAVFQAIDAIHAIAKAQQTSAAPAAAPQP